MGDKYCDKACNVAECGMDVGDCGLDRALSHAMELTYEPSPAIVHQDVPKS